MSASHTYTNVVINMRQREVSCIEAFMIIQEITMTHYNYNTHTDVDIVIDIGNRGTYSCK